MNHELYVSASGMIARGRALEVLSNNVANITTPGFKADTNVYSTFNKHLEKKVNLANETVINDEVQYGGAYVDYTQGPVKATDSPLDLAIEGDGFFRLTNGTMDFYTRAGNFHLDADGYLVTNNGLRVLGESGEINLPSDTNLLINDKGEIYSNGQFVDKIPVYSFSDVNALEKAGDNYFTNTDTQNNVATINESSVILQGALEQPNFNIVKGMTELIANLRMYETCQKSVKLIDELNSKVINQVGV